VQSNLITDCLILDGNPADTDLTDKMLDRHKEIYGHYPIKAALDGGFALKKSEIGQGQRHERCLLCKKARTRRRGYVPQPQFMGI